MEVEFYIKFGVEWNGGRIGNRLKRVEMDEETELEIFRLDGEFLLFWWGGKRRRRHFPDFLLLLRLAAVFVLSHFSSGFDSFSIQTGFLFTASLESMRN